MSANDTCTVYVYDIPDGTDTERDSEDWDPSHAFAHALPDGTGRLDAATWVYRRLEDLHEDNALSERAREFHISKEVAERKRLETEARAGSRREWEAWEKWGEAKVKSGMGTVTRHGESVRRILTSWAVVILWFWLLFSFSGGVKDTGGETHWVPITSLSELATMEGIREVLLNLYFSVITFSTIGYGDLSPHGPLSRAFVALESLAGAVLVALLIFVLGRRVAR